MASDVVIRDMRDGDTAAIIAVWQASGVARPWNDPARDIAFARRNPHSTVLVADIAGRIAARGVWKVQLLVRDDNLAVKQFYEHLGYRDTRSVCLQKIIG